ncbi:unnamed protein product [Pieris macdunnoughi]|uniref:Uncharacterized protein n=1 Tax=Pieris macdunnoughi TaxID=345717 RepID=A0A821QJU6_9NEOP|nr:unnamed protein product [Pieris macdunnoughi]
MNSTSTLLMDLIDSSSEDDSAAAFDICDVKCEAEDRAPGGHPLLHPEVIGYFFTVVMATNQGLESG